MPARDKDHHWLGETPNPDVYFGFVYEIIDLKNDRKYIGKKQYYKATGKFKSRPTAINSNKWRHYHWKESDWKNYTGSSKELNDAINKLGKENFKFIILEQYDCKASLHYGEIKHQVKNDVLIKKNKNGEYLYYNKSIAAIKFRPPDSHSDETKKKLSELLTANHPMRGKVHPNKGKKLPQCAPKDLSKRGDIYITNGTNNKWWDSSKPIPKGWKKGMKMVRKELTEKELNSRREASKKAMETLRKRLVEKTRFNSYDDLVKYIINSDKNKQQLAKELGIGWKTVDRITKQRS